MLPSKVILIDDSQEDAVLMERAVKQIADEVDFDWIGDAIEGLTLLRDWEQDESVTIFMDIKMPRLSGLEILADLKRRGKLQSIHQINVLSSSVLPRDINTATQYPNVAYYTKPEGYLALRELLTSVISPKPKDQACSMIERVLKVFLLEDRPMDAALTKRALLKFAPNAVITVANSEAEFLQRVHWSEYDIMLADYHLPGYNGLEALLYVREHFPHMPFIFVTGQLNNEQKAADVILSGANGYVLKDKMEELESSVKAALEKASSRRAQAEATAEKRQQRSLMLQKAMYILNQAPDFEEKKEIQDALKQVLQLE